MLIPSNDWPGFGVVHAQKAIIRAVENGYSVVRPDTHGLALAVDYQGRTLAAVDYFATERQIMVAYIPTAGKRTVYAAVGDVFVWLCIATLACAAGLTVRLSLRARTRLQPPTKL